MKKTSVLIRDLCRSRVHLNGLLAKRINELFPDKFFAGEIWRRIKHGRKIRSLLFLSLVNILNPRVKKSAHMDVCLSIEMVHAASCLVDDILDGDDVRHGEWSSQAILGTPVSVLQAHFLSARALELTSQWSEISKSLIGTYRRLTIGEMYDILLPEPTSGWICGGYTERVFQKTSAMFQFSFEAAALIAGREELRERLKSLGYVFGKLYQFSNDFYDMQKQNIRKRHSASQSWRITFSLPVACYLKLQGVKGVRAELKKGMLTYNEWMKFLEKIWVADVHTLAHDVLKETEEEVKTFIESSGLPRGLQQKFFGLVDLIMQEDFWYHSC